MPDPIPLPIDPHLPGMLSALRTHGSLVLVAEPGAGKTTRLPRAMLLGGLVEDGEVLVSQPRRLAVRMAARRVAAELGEEPGERIGYAVRFEDVSGPRTRVRFVTEGVLLRRLVADPELRGVSAVVIDEVHERHVETDLILALVARLRQSRRPDLRVAAMSATLEAEPVAALLGCQVTRVPGRLFHVEVDYLEASDDRPLEQRVVRALRRLGRDGLTGDVLVFLPGAGEIRRCREACAEVVSALDAEVVVLHGDLPADAQDRALRSGPKPRVILSTNVAETSVTIEGIFAVIDSGLARVLRCSPWSGLPGLVTEPISRSSAAQRAGRAGRLRPGRCLRLYSQYDHDGRPEHDVPEIRRADLAELLLTLRSLGCDPPQMPWLEAPPPPALDAASALLRQIGALDGEGVITDTGRTMVRFPAHPRLARLLLEAHSRGAGPEGCLVAALLGEREIRLSARTQFGGDAIGVDSVGPSDVLARMEAFEAAEADGLGAATVRAHGLDLGAVRAVDRSRRQLGRILDRMQSAPSREDAEEAVLRAVLAAFPDRVGRRRKPRGTDIVLAGGGSGRLAPSSVVRDAELMVAVEVDERAKGGTTIRIASAIEPEWLLEMFPERVLDADRVAFDPQGERVQASHVLTFDGLVLDEGRSTDAARDEVARVLCEAAVAAGPQAWCDATALERVRDRIDFAVEHGGRLERLSDERLRALLEDLCSGLWSFDALRRLSVPDVVLARLGGAARADLDRLAPERVALSGRHRGAPVSYARGRPPWLESRIQDFFGMREGPRVAGGRAPLVLHLLAPNGRAVQVTTDLTGFWARHYPAVRRELMRRYPRHRWPEDPLARKTQ